MVSALDPLMATNVGFAITFGLFGVALLTLFFLTARWAIRHDRAGYAAWRNRQQAAAPPTVTPTITPTPTTTTPTTTETTTPTETVAEGDGPPTSDP